MNTITELGRALEERSLSVMIHTVNGPGTPGAYFVVWLYAADDPAIGRFAGDGDTLEAALSEALSSWDDAEIVETTILLPEMPKC